MARDNFFLLMTQRELSMSSKVDQNSWSFSKCCYIQKEQSRLTPFLDVTLQSYYKDHVPRSHIKTKIFVIENTGKEPVKAYLSELLHQIF